MNVVVSFYLQFGVVFVLAAGLGLRLVWPKLARAEVYAAALPLAAFSALRITGLNFLSPLVTASMPDGFSVPAGYGDLVSSLLALAAFVGLLQRRQAGVVLSWAYVVFGGLEMVAVFVLGLVYDLPAHAGAYGLFIVLMLPAMIVALGMLAVVLAKNPRAVEAGGTRFVPSSASTLGA